MLYMKYNKKKKTTTWPTTTTTSKSMLNGHAEGGVVCESKMDTDDSTIEIAAGSHNARRCSDSYEPPQGKH